MRNVQQRLVQAPAGDIGVLLDGISSPQDLIWPAPAWPRLTLDAGLAPGSRGGHGPIRYDVAEYEPGRRLRFTFDPRAGLRGHHEFRIVPEGPARCRLVHTIEGTARGRMLLLWPLVIRWMHEALVQDLFDRVERTATGRVSAGPARWSAWVRLLRRLRGFPRRDTTDLTPAA